VRGKHEKPNGVYGVGLYRVVKVEEEDEYEGPPVVGPMTGFDLFLIHRYTTPAGPQSVRGVDGSKEGA